LNMRRGVRKRSSQTSCADKRCRPVSRKRERTLFKQGRARQGKTDLLKNLSGESPSKEVAGEGKYHILPVKKGAGKRGKSTGRWEERGKGDVQRKEKQQKTEGRKGFSEREARV